MSAPRIVLIHALGGSVGPIREAFAERWPAAQTVNLLDDSLSTDRARDGVLTDAMTERFVRLTRYAVDTGADAILFTCSAFHAAIDTAKAMVDIPVLKPDEAMMEAAVDIGSRITLMATFEPTLGTASAELEKIAGERGRSITVNAVHVTDALAQLQSGDPHGHEATIVAKAKVQRDMDVLLLAQFTMAPTAPLVVGVVDVPVLTSPGAAVDKLKGLLGA
jgi:Asp/Glu/hydantoin racemase